MQYGLLLKDTGDLTGRTFVCMDEVTHDTLADAISEAASIYAVEHKRIKSMDGTYKLPSSVVGIFSVEPTTGDIAQIHNRKSLIQAIDELNEYEADLDRQADEWAAHEKSESLQGRVL